MARRRHQHPKPKKLGNWWYIRVRVEELNSDGSRERKRKWVQLCGAETKVRQVSKIADRYLNDHINNGVKSIAGAQRIGTFIDSDYLKDFEKLAKPTRDCYDSKIEQYIRPAFGGKCFRELDYCMIEDFFYQMEKSGAEYPTIAKVWDTLSSILRSATHRRVMDENPMEKAQKPKDKRIRRRKPVITPEQFEQLLAGMKEPYATMLYVAVWTGLRVSELLALKWRCIGEESITIDERYFRGDWAKTKTQESAATISATPEVVARLERLKDTVVTYRAGRATRKLLAVRAYGPDDLVFQSVWKGRPMSEGNILRRHIKPAARAVGLDAVSWRVLRRSHATWLIQAGADPKAVQGQMRHSRITTTMDIYAQVVPEGQKEALRKLAAFVPQRRPVMGQNIAVVSGAKGEKVVSIR